ncbi:MAG: hypothetical protein FWF36_04565 [Propionibacteriaceae bacterium]|nr:hypothetical protein [Propionibacteriaceae bacterium]
MSMLQVRNLSPATHDELKRRAAWSRMSLSDYVARELDTLVAVPDPMAYWWHVDDTPEETAAYAERWAEVDAHWDPVATGAANMDEYIVNLIRERRGPLS